VVVEKASEETKRKFFLFSHPAKKQARRPNGSFN